MKRDMPMEPIESNLPKEKCSGILQCIAIDDDEISLYILKKYCSKLPCVSLNKVFNNPLDALGYLKNNKFDLVFLDIQMPEISGISIARKLKGQSMVIFTTSYKDFAIQGYALDAIDFLLKPFDFDRFYHAVSKAKEHHDFLRIKSMKEVREDYIIIKEDYQNVKVNLSDILYIEALDNYVKIHTQHRTYLTLKNLKAMIDHLSSKHFMRVHKSYIVALNQIDHFSRDRIHINGAIIPVGRTFAKKFLQKISN